MAGSFSEVSDKYDESSLLDYFDKFELTSDEDAGELGNSLSHSGIGSKTVEGWHRAFQMGIGCAHSTIHKYIFVLRKERSFSETKLVRIIAGKSAVKVTKYEKSQTRLVELLKHYSNNNILKQLDSFHRY